MVFFLTSFAFVSTGTNETLQCNDQRLVFDDRTLSKNLFTLTKKPTECHIVANSNNLLGQGLLVLNMRGIYSVRVKFDIVGFLLLRLYAFPYPTSDKTKEIIKSIKRPGKKHGSFQQVAIKMSMVLSDNCTYEVTIKDDTSYYFATNDAVVKVKFNVVPVNVLHVDRESGYGTVKIWAEFKGKRSSDLDLVISHEMMTIKDLRSVRLDVVNDTFSGLAGSATAQLEVEVLLNDSSIILIKIFSIYSGLKFFTCNKSDTVTVDHVTGVVTLLSDSPYPVSVTATVSHNPSIAKAAVFFSVTQYLVLERLTLDKLLAQRYLP